jgi:hypothetical protein
MMNKWWCLAWCLGLAVGGCGNQSDNGGGSTSTPAGALPCNGLAIDCRTAFADNYSGSFEGDRTGDFTLSVDVLGGIQGTATGPTSITGQVNEFGQINFSFPDGTTFTGQFNADHHSFAGTWKSPSGQAGTFHGQSTTFSGDGGLGDGGSDAAAALTASTVMAASETACQHAVSCGNGLASACPAELGQTEPMAPEACWAQELALYQCISNGTCAYQTECASANTALENCILGAQSDAGTAFNPPLTGSPTLDDIVHLCAYCATEAQACYDSQACRDYAACVDGCTAGDTACTHACTLLYSDGFVLYANAYTCRANDC